MSYTDLKVLGPFLMKPTPQSMGFWMLAPEQSETSKIRVEILSSEKVIATIDLKRLNSSDYGVWLGESDKVLIPSTSYSYRISIDEFDFLPPDFVLSDLMFKTLPAAEEGDVDFVLLSCNGIEEYEKHFKDDPTKNPWAMWERLLEVVRNNPSIYFSILGGDQVYMDETFEDDKDSLKNKKPEEIRNRISSVYKKYWGHSSYRKIMARLPALLMWDDHDLIDGFGSRPEQFDKKGEEVKGWSIYRDYLTKAFYEFQACRNPGGNDVEKGPFSFSTQISTKGFVVLDLRSERNSIKNQLLLDSHKEVIKKEVDKLIDQKIDTLFFVSPVTVTRMGGSIEEAIGKISNYLWRVSSSISHNRNIFKPMCWWLLASICFIVVQMSYQGKSGYPSVVMLLIFSVLNLAFDHFNGKNYLPEKFHKWSRRINSILSLSLLIYVVFFWDWAGINNQTALQMVLDEFITAAIYDSEVLLLSFISSVALYLSTSKKISTFFRTISRFLAIVSMLLTVIALVWIGMPEEKSNLAIWIRLVPMFILQFLGFSFYLISIAEGAGVIDLIAGLDDDIKDAWSSEVNVKELNWLRDLCKQINSKGVKTVVLTGDIHTGGLSKISISKKFENEDAFTYQIVSSPISYIPMEYLVEKLTSGNSITVLPREGDSLYAYNLFYRCERNFVVIKTRKGQRRNEALFYFEDIIVPEVVEC